MRAKEVEAKEVDYCDYIDECYGEVEVCGYKYPSSQVLQEVDPIAFRVGFSDWSSENQKYKCDECGEEFDNESDAEDCCKVPCAGCGELFDKNILSGIDKCPACTAEWVKEATK
jgi:DNA-directed RNA polymerase subunit RPC12/RpoP